MVELKNLVVIDVENETDLGVVDFVHAIELVVWDLVFGLIVLLEVMTEELLMLVFGLDVLIFGMVEGFDDIGG